MVKFSFGEIARSLGLALLVAACGSDDTPREEEPGATPTGGGPTSSQDTSTVDSEPGSNGDSDGDGDGDGDGSGDSEPSTPSGETRPQGGFALSPISGDVAESGTTATFTVALINQPSANTTLPISSSDPGEGVASPGSLVFTKDNWETPQTITVTGVDDFEADGTVGFSVVLGPSVSEDSFYNGLDPDNVALSNIDNDSAGFSVSAISGSIAENGSTASFSVALTSQPTADVSISISTGDPTEGTVSPASLTFTSSNWNAAQAVTVTGVDDATADGTVTFTVFTGAASSADTTYNGLNPDDVSVSTTDDDTPGFAVTAISGNVSESGSTATFTVALTSLPSADVTFPLSSSDTSEGTVSPASLTFTSANWMAAQTVTVTGVDDPAIDGTVAFTVIAGAVASLDGNYNGLDPIDVSLSNLDDDSAGSTVSSISGSVSEDATTATFSVALSSQPSANVTIALTSSDTGEGTVSPSSLTFTPANWSSAQTAVVTGVDDDIIDGTVDFSITTAAASSSDSDYNGYNPSDVSVSNTDNDSAGVTVSDISGDVSELGTTATFTAFLTSQPSANVTFPLSSSDTGEGSVAPGSLTFTNSNWNIPQTVTVTGVDDAQQDGSIAFSIIVGATVSSDSDYNGLDPDDVSVSNSDDDSAGFTLTGISNTVSEGGTTATFTVKLTTQPSDDVTIPLSSDDISEGTVSPSSLTFTDGNWSTAQTVTVTGIDDSTVDGDVAFSIVLNAATSSDSDYNTLDPNDVSVTNTDDDAAGFILSAISGDTAESGTTATFTAKLTSQPSGDVTWSISSSDSSEGTVSPATLTFTNANWNSDQTVTVTGVDDFAIDGSVAYSIINGTASSVDDDYDGLDPNDVSVSNTDDDSAGYTVSAISGNTSETGTTATFTVSLQSQPTADVSLSLSSSDLGEGTILPGALTFTSSNWSTPQTATVTGVDDYLIDGTIAFSIVTGSGSSSDGDYHGLDPADVSVSNSDNDVAGVTVSSISGDVSESGTTATFTAVLTAQPTADVTLGLSSSDTGEGTISPSSLTFTSSDWNSPQTATVTGIDDPMVDGTIGFTIVTGATSSSDSNFNGLDPSDVSVSNTDDDNAGVTISEITGDTSEDGTTATFTAVLTSQPSSNVTFSVSSSDTGEGTVSPSSLTFTSANWDTVQTVTVTGADDSIIDGDVDYTITTGSTSSSDGNYSGLNPDDVAVSNLDDDVAGITVSAISGNATEAGGTATYTAVLTSQPSADVTFSVSSSDTGEGTVSPSSLTFTNANWNTYQTVTITGVDDSSVDGTVTYTIVNGAASSSDSDYDGIDPNDISASTTDDDVAGFSITDISGNTTEDGGTATFTVALTSQPSDDVTIAVSSDDTGEGTVSPGSLSFTSANWNTPQTVTATGVDDGSVDGTVSYNIVLGAGSSSDSNYNGLDPSDVALANADNDGSKGFTVSALSGSISETGSTATFTIVLGAAPSDSVTIPSIYSTDTGEATVSPTSMVFTTSNWSTPQTVTITGVDDILEDGNQNVVIITDPATSSDSYYNDLDPSNHVAVNFDDDSFGVTVTTTGSETDESGNSQTISVVLKSPPTANVTVTLTSSDATEGAFPSASQTHAFTFTTGNWNTRQSVVLSGQDDALTDGDQGYQVSFAVASTDTDYNALVIPNSAFTNTDDETIGFVISPISGNTDESGGEATFTVKLTTAPTTSNTVTIGLSSSDTTEGAVSPTSLVFTESDWSTPQTVTVTGEDDNKQDGNQTYSIVTAAATSGDSRYNGLDPANVDLTNLDDDDVGFNVSEVVVNVDEYGLEKTFTVSLMSAPTADVTFSLTSNDITEATVSPSSLTFTSTNWATSQTVTVTGVDDVSTDGTVSTEIELAAASSTDSNYNGLDPNDVVVNCFDNDTPGVTVLPLEDLTVSEAGTQATFTVVLKTQPTDDVTFAVSSSDTDEVSIAPATLTFTTDNWNNAQTVVATGVDDSDQDGSIETTVSIASPTTSDTTYAAINPRDVTVHNLDDDTIGYVVTTNDYGGTAIPTVEDGSDATFTVALASPPTDDVTITMYSDDTAEGTVKPSSLTFTSENWNAAQTVTVTGVDDGGFQDGAVEYAIKFNNASSGDSNYDGTKPTSDVQAVNFDDDGYEFIIIPYQASLSITEQGTQTTFAMRLAKKPSQDVSIDFASDDTTEGISSPSGFVFTKNNYDAFQTVTVSAQDDTDVDGNVSFDVKFEDATSQDTHYDSTKPDFDVTVLNYDDD